MTLTGDANFKGKLTHGLKNDTRNLVNFHASSQYSEKLQFEVLLLSIAYKVSAENVQKCYLSWHWRVIQTFCLKNDMTNLVKFNATSGKPKNLNFDGLLLLKVCNVWAKKIQRSCVVKNDLWFPKLHKEFVEFSHK